VHAQDILLNERKVDIRGLLEKFREADGVYFIGICLSAWKKTQKH